jgi:hypothetical protein
MTTFEITLDSEGIKQAVAEYLKKQQWLVDAKDVVVSVQGTADEPYVLARVKVTDGPKRPGVSYDYGAFTK